MKGGTLHLTRMTRLKVLDRKFEMIQQRSTKQSWIARKRAAAEQQQQLLQLGCSNSNVRRVTRHADASRTHTQSLGGLNHCTAQRKKKRKKGVVCACVSCCVSLAFTLAPFSLGPQHTKPLLLPLFAILVWVRVHIKSSKSSQLLALFFSFGIVPL